MNTEPQLGRIEGELSAKYHATHAISNSKLKDFARNPGGPALYFQKYIEKSIERKDSPAMAFGRALHCLALEGGGAYLSGFAVRPEGIDRRTNAGKAAYSEFESMAVGKDILTAEADADCRRMAGAIHAHPIVAPLLRVGTPEETWRVKASGLVLAHCPPLQVRTDWFCEEGCNASQGRPYVVDIKTCESLEAEGFGSFDRAVVKHGYHRQAAFYMAVMNALGVSVRDFFFVSCEKSAPYGVQAVRLTDAAIEQGQKEVERLLIEINKCYETNIWTNAGDQIITLDLPRWYYAEQEKREG